MKRKLFFLIAVFLIAYFPKSYGQNQKEIDSLERLLAIHLKRDTVRVNVLIDAAGSTMNNDVEKSKKFTDEQLRISDSLHYDFGLAYGYLRLGFYYSIKGNNELFLLNTKKCLEYSEKNNYSYLKGVCYMNLGTRQMLISGNSDSALIYFNKAIQSLNKNNKKDAEVLGIVFSNSAGIYLQRGDYNKALEYYIEAEKSLIESNYIDNLPVVYVNLSMIYSDQLKNKKEAKNYAEKALKAAQQSNNMLAVAFTYKLLGNLEDNATLQREYYRKSLAINRESENKEESAEVYNLIGRSFAYSTPGTNYDSALYYCEKGLAEKTDNQHVLIAAHEFIGYSYLKKGLYSEALKHLQEALSLAEKMKDRRTVTDILKNMKDAYAGMNDYKNAYKYSESYADLKDSLLDEEKVKALDEMSSKYESGKKENQIALLNKDKEVKDAEIKKQKQLKNFFIIGLALLAILSVFVFNSFRVRNKLRLQNIRNKIASDLHDDIGSTLNSISVYSEVAKQKSPKVVQELDQIGEASRKIIDAMSDIVWTINPKNDSFENIILRMRSLSYNLLKAKNIEHTFRADENLASMKLSLEERRNFFLIFKEAVNNLVKYSEATRASITLSHENNLVKLSVRDNGKGFDVKQFSTGNGLFNMRNRAAEMNADIKIESEPGKGTNIELAFKV